MNKTTYVLEYDAKEAFEYFLLSRNYCATELPEYISFKPVLDYVHETIGDKPFNACTNANNTDYTGVNLSFLMNKDGKYAVRPLVVSNPFLYYFLVREICQPDNWKAIGECFDFFNLKHTEACAVPVVPAKKESFHNSTTILNWWKRMEQKSLELSLDYKYMFVTDITNCYGSINPQTIDWALSRKGTQYATESNHQLAQTIIGFLQKLMEGRNIGIPQGSTLYDFIAEIILGYADLLLEERIAKRFDKLDYHILRYRDDYRIFCNDKGKLEDISYMLQQLLEELGFRMNAGKTKISTDIVGDSIKPDKLFNIFNTPIFKITRTLTECDFSGFEKAMLYILQFGRKYPNSGQVRALLSNLNTYVEDRLKLKKQDNDEWEEVDLGDDYSQTPTNKLFNLADLRKAAKAKKETKEDRKETKETSEKKSNMVFYVQKNITAMAAVLSQIAVENVSSVPYTLQVLSNLLVVVNDTAEVKQAVIKKVYNRLCGQPNSDYTQVWLQHITLNDDIASNNSPYTLSLCKLVWGKDVALWNNSWMNPALVKGLPYGQICDREKAKNMSPRIKISKPLGRYDADDEYGILEISL